MHFSRVVKLSVVLTGYARAGMRQSAKMKNFMRRSRALRCASIIVVYSADAKWRLAKMNCKVGSKLTVLNELLKIEWAMDRIKY